MYIWEKGFIRLTRLCFIKDIPLDIYVLQICEYGD